MSSITQKSQEFRSFETFGSNVFGKNMEKPDAFSQMKKKQPKQTSQKSLRDKELEEREMIERERRRRARRIPTANEFPHLNKNQTSNSKPQINDIKEKLLQDENQETITNSYYLTQFVYSQIEYMSNC